jgi:catechol 2,3-dioxygenase-like lactoylglutathione lyase family enzyme
MAAVHSLDRIVFTVPDLAAAERFYAAFGLRTEMADGELALFTDGNPHCWAVLHEVRGQPKKLQYLSFGCFEQDFEAIAQNAEMHRLTTCEPHPLSRIAGLSGDSQDAAQSLWLQHPEGFPVQIRPAPKSSPTQKSVASRDPVVPEGCGAAPNRARVPQVRPRRLSHALFFSGDVAGAVAFYEQALGLRVTDRSSDVIVFMHGVHGSDHHLLALAKSDGPGLHHLSWDVASVDQVGMGMEQMLIAGHERGWGVGRHVLGSNYFYYVRDPWGSYCEYSFDIDFVPYGFDWPSADHPLEDSFYVWGPRVPEDFVKNYETTPQHAPEVTADEITPS